MDIGRLFKWLAIVAIVFLAWKYGMPLIGGRGGHHRTPASDNSCIGAAQRATETWGSGVGRFVNPPYDLDAWNTFKGGVDSKIAEAESACNDSSESSQKVQAAMGELRSLASDLDTAIRNGSAPPSDVPQRQESIDRQLDEAADLTRSGK